MGKMILIKNQNNEPVLLNKDSVSYCKKHYAGYMGEGNSKSNEIHFITSDRYILTDMTLDELSRVLSD